MTVPQEGALFFSRFSVKAEPFSPRSLSVRQATFSDILAACVLIVNYGGRDSYVADAEAEEVYLVNNDEMVIASIPDLGRRTAALDELHRLQPVVEDVSGYSGSANID